MSKRGAETIRKRLQNKLEELTGNKNRRNELIAERSNDPMDQVQSRLELDMAVNLVNTDFQTRRSVKTALALLDAGKYGVCQDCGEAINPNRLEAIPWTTLCVTCQEEIDATLDGVDNTGFRRAA